MKLTGRRAYLVNWCAVRAMWVAYVVCVLLAVALTHAALLHNPKPTVLIAWFLASFGVIIVGLCVAGVTCVESVHYQVREKS